jgi:YVTN family beta-propeller protein
MSITAPNQVQRKRTARILFCAAIAFSGVCLLPAALAVSAEGPAAVHPAINGNRGPFAIAFTKDGSKAVVTEFDEGAVGIIDTASGKVLEHIATGGTEPTGVAVTPDGLHAVVTNSFSGSVAFIDLAAHKCVAVPLTGAPWGVILSPDGSRAYITVSQLDLVAVFNVATHKEIGTIPTGRRPRAIDMTPDGSTLVTANMTAGSVSYLDTAAMVQRSQGVTPAVNLRGVALFPDGRTVFAVGQRAQNERPTETAVGIWSNQAFVQVPNGPRNGRQNLWLDLMGSDVSDPDSVVMDAPSGRAFVTCSGGNSLNVVPVRGNGDTVTIKSVGAQPRGLAMTPDRKEIWVANLLGNDIAVIDTSTLMIKRRISLGATSHKDPHMLGRYLFGTAEIVKGAQFSCNSCHPDGGVDGISWKFTHVQDALGKTIDRNVKGLRGKIAADPPYRWSGHETSLASFVDEEVSGLMQGPKLTPAQTAALADYVGSLPLTANPYRTASGRLTDAALRGKALFDGKAGCIRCHTNSNQRNVPKTWIGTTPQGVLLQPPRLEGAYDTDPYLHDGSAQTLEEIFTKHNDEKLHGNAHLLTDVEMKDLLRYVKEL